MLNSCQNIMIVQVFISCSHDLFLSNIHYNANLQLIYTPFLGILDPEDEVTVSPSTATPNESMDIDDDQERRLLSPVATSKDLSFVKEAKVK